MKYITLQGRETTKDDPDRMVWASCCCTFWTDDVDSLGRTPQGIPVCPACYCSGFQFTAERWDSWADDYQTSKPQYAGYVAFLNATKEKCHGRKTLRQLWQAELESRG